MYEFKYTFDNYIYKKIINYTITDEILLFEVKTTNGTTFNLLYAILKKDHLYNYTKYIFFYVIKGKISTLSLYNKKTYQFMKQYK